MAADNMKQDTKQNDHNPGHTDAQLQLHPPTSISSSSSSSSSVMRIMK